MSQPTPALTVQRAEEIIRQLTDGLVNIKDETGQFLLKRASPASWLAGDSRPEERELADSS
jgi:hypothetical protein